jgi:hypothetical protein
MVLVQEGEHPGQVGTRRLGAMIEISDLCHQDRAKPEHMIKRSVAPPGELLGFRFFQPSTGEHQRRLAAADLVLFLSDEVGEYIVDDRCRTPSEVSATFQLAVRAAPFHMPSLPHRQAATARNTIDYSRWPAIGFRKTGHRSPEDRP